MSKCTDGIFVHDVHATLTSGLRGAASLMPEEVETAVALATEVPGVLLQVRPGSAHGRTGFRLPLPHWIFGLGSLIRSLGTASGEVRPNSGTSPRVGNRGYQPWPLLQEDVDALGPANSLICLFPKSNITSS